MKKNLYELIADIINDKSTGLLMIGLKGNNALLKIYFKNGPIYHMSGLNLKGAECLHNMSLIEFSGCHFVPGEKIETGPSDLPSTDEIIRYLQTKEILVEYKQFDGRTSATETGKVSSELFDRVKEGIVTALMKQIGPAGMKFFKQAVAKWQIDNPPTRDGIHQLISLLGSEIDDKENRDEFIKEAMRIVP